MNISPIQGGGLSQLLQQTQAVVIDQKNTINIIDVKPAVNALIEDRINNIPNDLLAQQQLKAHLEQLSYESALSAGRNQLEDGTTLISISEKTVKEKPNSNENQLNTEPYRVFVNTITNRINDGLAEGESTEALSQLLDNASQGAISAHSEVRNILSALGKLDPSASDYINRSDSYVRFGLAQQAAQFNQNDELFEFSGKAAKELQFTITTNEGDKINISLAFKQQKRASDLTYGQSVSLNYKVDGDLNAKEHEAFNTLLSAVAESSDALLNGASFNDLIGLESFDATQLSGFNLILDNTGSTAALSKNRYEFSYQQDLEDQKVSFSHKIINPLGSYKEVSNMTLSSNIGGSYDENSIQAMLDIIAQADTVAHKNDRFIKENSNQNSNDSGMLANSLQSFFKTAERLGKALNHANQYLDNSVSLANDMFKQISEHDPRYQGITPNDKDRLTSGFSKLADHQITYKQATGDFTTLSDTISKNANGFSAQFSQTSHAQSLITRTEKNTPTSSEKNQQQRSYKVNAVKNHGVIERGNIVKDKWQVEESYQINLATINSLVVGLDQSRTRDESRDSFTYSGGGQYSRHQEKEQSQADSQIRNIEGLWLERQNSQHKGYEQFDVYNGRRAEDLDLSETMINSYSEQSEKLTIIGDLEKLANNNDYRNKKQQQIQKINELMTTSDNKLNLKI